MHGSSRRTGTEIGRIEVLKLLVYARQEILLDLLDGSQMSRRRRRRLFIRRRPQIKRYVFKYDHVEGRFE